MSDNQEHTHNFKECSCDDCKRMCSASPCLGTPNDVLRLIEKGKSENLARTLVLDPIDNKLVPVIALNGTTWSPMPGATACKCSMQDENGFCKLHDQGLKPTEGKLAICGQPHKFYETLRHSVLQEWDSPLGQSIQQVIK